MATPDPVKSQYHHYIPRFILRNFAHPPPKDSPKGGKRARKNGGHPGEHMLSSINLSGFAAEVIETPVSRTFGMVDMYRDIRDATNQHHIEEQFSRLESRASQIIHKIRTAFEAGEQAVWISRPDRDLLRKFLFIMKYRSSGFHQRFYHTCEERYREDDRERLLKYMREKGYKRPVDVWFDNIKAMLELKMDTEGKWMGELRKRIYPDDAEWFVAHTQMMYLALCAPSHKDDEFLLAENVYGIHEGPSSYLTNPDTGESTPWSYTEYHIFAAISPKLLMVCRSFLLPIPEEDSNENTRRWRETMMQLNVNQHTDPQNANSILEDLPINKARNSYSEVVDGRIVLLQGEDGSPRPHHKFCFRFFPISTDHVNKINGIMLEQSDSISTIVFGSRLAARKTLEYYLSLPCKDKGPSFKVVFGPSDPKLLTLKKLEQAAQQLGSATTAVYRMLPPTIGADDKLKALGQMLEKALPKEPSKFMKLYMKLGKLVSDGAKNCTEKRETQAEQLR